MQDKSKLEHLRQVLRDQFINLMRSDWIDKALWMSPSRAKHMLLKDSGKRENHHIVDTTHLIAHRALVSGFLEGNTSSTRSWFRFSHPDPRLNNMTPVKGWMQNLNDRCLAIASSSNLYHALAELYHDWSIFDTSVLYIDELPDKGPHFSVLGAGTYYLMNDYTGIANVLVREFPLTVKEVVEKYAQKVNGEYDLSIFSDRVKNMWEDGSYDQIILVCEVCKPNDLFDFGYPEGGQNRKWVCCTYECADTEGAGYYAGMKRNEFTDDKKFLRIQYRTRKPFIAVRNMSSNNFAYGETGPTTNAIGAIKSLNKKALNKDIAIELMLRPPMQGPASLKKSYQNSGNPGSYVPWGAQDAAQGGAKPLMQMNPAINTLNEDVADLRNMVRKMFYEDLMLFLSQNPKTRTAEEVRAVMAEQQLVIGPALQSLNYTLNTPLVEYLAAYAIEVDPYVGEPPPEIAGTQLKIVFISVFAQAQRSADLPGIDRYIAMVSNVGQLNPAIWDKANLDVLANLYDDRLYLPAGLNRSDAEVAQVRQDRQQQQAQQQQMLEAAPAMAKARKDEAQAQATMAGIEG